MRLPSTDDKLFIGADDWWMNACLDWYHDPSELYIVGYKEAADSLVETIACRKGTADTLIFPIVFLYRQLPLATYHFCFVVIRSVVSQSLRRDLRARIIMNFQGIRPASLDDC